MCVRVVGQSRGMSIKLSVSQEGQSFINQVLYAVLGDLPDVRYNFGEKISRYLR